MVNRRILLVSAFVPAVILLSSVPSAMAREVPATPPPSSAILDLAAGMPLHASVQAFYGRWQGPAWFDDGGRTVAELIRILRRAPLDGFAAGPSLVDQVEKAAQAAVTDNPVDRAAAERVLSAAWAAYVGAIRQPVGGMIYGYDSLAPKPMDIDQILAAAATAPSLEQHLASISAINPMYAELREAAWREMQSSSTAADPRVLSNLARLRSVPATNRFVFINVATQRMHMYENGQPVDSMKVIVGTREMPTPMIASVIYYTTFNPYWNVPDHLVRKTVAPNVLRQGTAYLKSRGYQVMSDWSESAAVMPSDKIDWKAAAADARDLRVRQLPGPYNSMGKFKFSFANGEDIFLHDTPSKELFANARRDLSSGCIRLEDARRFARWLLGREPDSPTDEPEHFVQLPQGVPVYVTYLTAQPVEGKVVYSPDIYGWDPAT